MRQSGEKKHNTNYSDIFAYERTDNWYYHQNNVHDYPVVSEGFRALPSDDSAFAPLTVYNSWPKKLSNASIFPYLLQPKKEDEEFYYFVQKWYRCSCAIVYDSPKGDCKVIGTGCLTDCKDKEGNLLIATARHNYNNFSKEKLFARFFNYQVAVANNDWLKIQESHLDVPVIGAFHANGGLDAGYLILHKLQDASVFSKYAQVLLIDREVQSLPEGQYAMFHFAGGNHLISLGEIESSMNFKLHDDVVIQAGPGASGAAMIWHALDKTKGLGTSIYRIIDKDSVERRLIAFSEFNKGPRWVGNIKAPYRSNLNFSIISTSAFNESGYEFLRYRSEAYGGKGQRPQHPNHVQYYVADNHSNHHIIPIEDLLYLWNYLHNLDDDTKRQIIEKVNSIAEENYQKQKKALCRDILENYSTEYNFHWKSGSEKLAKEKENFKKEHYNFLFKEELMRRYHAFYLVIEVLSRPHNNNAHDKTWFAWSWWNLFQGWKCDYRYDDPAKHPSGLDFSEKTKPQGYSPSLWKCLKTPGTGLYAQIQLLKKETLPNKKIEESLYNSLEALGNEWKKRNAQQQIIHPFDANEWEIMGNKDGHPIYRIR